MNHEYNINLMKDILYKNNIKDSRILKLITICEKMVFDLREKDRLLTTKRMPFKTIVENYCGLSVVQHQIKN